MKQQNAQQPNQQPEHLRGTLPLSRFASFFILSAFTIFGICVCILVAVVSDSQFDKIQQIEHQKRINSLGDHVVDYVHHRLDILNDQARFSSIKQAVMHPDERKADITDFMSTLSIMGTKPQIVLLDFAGTEIHKTQVNPNVDFSGYQWISQIIDGKLSNYTGILHLPGGPHLCIAVPVLYGGMPEGILTTVIPLQNMVKSSHLANITSGEELKIVQDGTVLTSVGTDNASGSTQEIVLNRFNLTLQLTGQKTQITTARNRILFMIFGVLLFMSVLVALTMVAIARKLFVKPLLQMRYAARNISNKTGKVIFSKQNSPIQEIALLNDDLKVMAKQVDNRESKLQELVQERTGELKTQKERLDNILEGTNVGTWEWNVQTGETIFNEKWANIIGYTLNEISPVSIDTWMKFAHPDDLKKSEELLEKHFNGELDYYHFESRMKHKDGSWIWVLDRGKIMSRDDDGKPLWVFGTHQDITERKQSEEKIRKLNLELEERVQKRTEELKAARKQAEQANRAKSEFLANMSHEIRTPMNAVLGFTQVLERDPSLTPKQSKQVNSISRSGNHLLGLINDILDISKIEAGKIELSPSVCSLQDLLDDLEMMFRSRVEGKHLQLIVDRDEGLPSHVRADEDKVRKILVNLLGNAVKFTEEGGIALRVRSQPVRGRTQGEDKSLRLEFEVEDSGPGISQSDLDRIFDKFNQAEAGARAGGTGLGLPISKQLAEMMGGGITCESEVGKGSCFYFDLLCEPAEAEQKESRESRRVTGLASGTKPGRILVVDDNAPNRDLLHALLQPLGFEIREAENGREAVDIFEEWSPRAVLMDVRMPVMDGYEATRRIKATQAGRDVPVIVVTASVFKDKEEEILANGASAYISKPFQDEEFYEVLGKYLGLSFVYEDESAAAQKDPKARDLTPEDLAALPRDLVQAMLEALAAGDITRLLELIRQVEPLDSDVAQGLKALADHYDYSTMEKLLSNGGNDNE